MLLASGPALALDDRAALADYARARVADASGDIQNAAAGYAAVLDEAPFDEALATRAFRRAIAAGDRYLARRAADQLYANHALPPDGEFLFLVAALDNRDWDGADTVVDRIEEQGLFASLTPLLRAWTAIGKDEDPFALIDGAGGIENSPYAVEHRALLMLAQGNNSAGIDAIRAIEGLAPARRTRLLISAAATVAEQGERDAARALLQDEPGRAFQSAREQLQRRRGSLPGEIATPSQGIAELLSRLAADIGRRDSDSLALTLARYASFLAPDNPVAWLIAANILIQDGQHQAALAALDHVSAHSPYLAEAQDLRVQALLAAGERDRALALVREQSDQRNADVRDWLRVGALYSQLERNDDAVVAYRNALDVDREGQPRTEWTTWLLYGGALIDAGRWNDGRDALDQALELAPQEPVLLNYLGYALLERREQLDRAEDLIRRASAMSPDNPAITDSLGWVLFVRGNLGEAIPTLERAAVAAPDEPTINEHLGDAYWTAGRRRDARFAWQAALVSAEEDAALRINRKIDIGLTPETASP